MPTPLQIWGSSCVFYAEFGDASSVSVVDGLAAAFTDKASGITYTQPTVGSRMAYQPTGYGGGGAILMASGKTFTFPQPANFPSGNAPHTIIIVGRYTASNAYPTPFAYGGRSPRAFRSMSARNRRVNAGFFGDDHESTGLGWANVERMVVSMVDGASPVNSWLFNAPNASETKTLAGPLVTPTSSTVEINRTADSFDGPVRAIIVLNRMSTLDELSSGYSYFSQPYSAGGGGATTPDSAYQAQVASSPTLSAKSAVQPDAAVNPSVATSPVFAARATAQPDSSSRGNAATSPALASRATVAPNSALQSHVATSPTLSVAGSVSPEPAVHTHVASSPTLTPKAVVAPVNAAQGHQATSPGLSNVRSTVAPASSYRANAATQPSLGVAGTISIDSASHQQVATSPSLAARSSVVPASAVQASAATSPSIGVRVALTIDSAFNSNVATSPTVTPRFNVSPASSIRLSTSTSPTLSAKAMLLIDSALHGHFATSPALFAGGRPRPPSARTVRSVRSQRIAYSSRPPRLAA